MNTKEVISTLNDLIETFSLVVERRSNIFHPLIHSDVMVLAVGAKCFSLGSKIFLLRHRRHASIRNHLTLLRRDQTAILQILFMCVVPPIRGTAVGMQDTLTIPFLQGVDGFSNQLPELFR